jgi:hypothetical protein
MMPSVKRPKTPEWRMHHVNRTPCTTQLAVSATCSFLLRAMCKLISICWYVRERSDRSKFNDGNKNAYVSLFTYASHANNLEKVANNLGKVNNPSIDHVHVSETRLKRASCEKQPVFMS